MGGIDRYVSETAVDEERQVDVAAQFDGARHFNLGKWFYYINPGPSSDGGSLVSDKFRHRDVLHRITWRPKDTQRYISPTYGKPYHLMVQATREVLQDKSGTWRRREVRGNAPWLLRLSSWVLKDILEREKGAMTPAEIALIAGKVLAAAPLQMILLLFPMGDATHKAVHYKGLPAHSFEYPVYARNALDARPDYSMSITQKSRQMKDVKEHARLLRPRRLVVWGPEGWRVESNTAETPYIFVSYTRRHWDPQYPDSLPPLHKLARHMARSQGVRAYWLDHQCIAPSGDVTEDIHQICDVVRGADQVCVAVPNLDSDTLAVWGGRMWTMPEVLLCQNNMIKFCAPDKSIIERSRVSLAEGVWGHDQTARLLAEHFSGSLTLSRLELIQTALKALSARDTKALYSNGDLAYALMGLLNRRPKANMQDTQFQALARLSLANDSDSIVERMMCMLPPPEAGIDPSSRKFVLEDALNANLWDIEPLCQVAGVCAGSGVMLDGCRGASIRWKNIPSIAYVKRRSMKRTMIAMLLRSGTFWFITGAVFAGVGGPYMALGVIFLLIGLALVFSSPWSVTMLYGGKVWGATPWLIGIEGVMPASKIEKFAFGNSIGRLRWAASSSLLSCQNSDERLGVEPEWIKGNGSPRPEIPVGHRIFTLVDTGTMTCHVFTAERPPSAAVIAGREGGMLRVILCSYERSSGTLIKETVLRMETPMLDKAGLLGWIKMA